MPGSSGLRKRRFCHDHMLILSAGPPMDASILIPELSSSWVGEGRGRSEGGVSIMS